MCYPTIITKYMYVSFTSSLRDWNEDALKEAISLLSEELQLSADAPGGMPEYRKSLVTSFFFKFYLTVSQLLTPDSLPDDLLSATHKYHRSVVTVSA